MARIIGAKNIPDNGEVSWHCHADNGAGYDTLCGLSLYEDDFISAVVASKGQKCDCAMCYQTWQAASVFRKKDFC
jgi:hypothetical protein